MARKKRVVIPNRCYHLVSRVAHRAFFFNDDEKRRFTDFLMRVASFSGVRLLGWCVMSNHFHLFVYLPEEEPLSDDQLLDRIHALYRGSQLQMALDEWNDLKKEAEEEAAKGITCGSRFADLKNRLRNRMYHPGEFMKTLKQYVTTSFNGRRRHFGTLWENRYKVRVSKPVSKDMSAQLAYIDCNPCEAGICGNPADYAWSGWHAAMAGDETAREMYRFVYGGDELRFENGEMDLDWTQIVELHEQAMRERLGEIKESQGRGEEVDWMFASTVDDSPDDGESNDDESDDGRQAVDELPAGHEMDAPPERAFQIPGGRSEVAERIVAFLRDDGAKSAAAIAEHLGMSSRSFLLKTYLKPLVASGHLALSIPDKPRSQNQKYRLP